MIDIDYFLDVYNWSLPGLIAMLLLLSTYLFLVRSSLSQKLFFIIGTLLIYLVLGSPVANLTKFGLHSVSMLQHIVLLMVAPILLLKSFPKGIFQSIKIRATSVFANPKRYFIVLWLLSAVVMWGGHFLSAAIMSAKTGTAICGITLPGESWISDIPGSLIFSTLLISGILFLLPVLHPDVSKRLKPVKSVIYLFSACISCSLLGLYVAFSAGSASLAEALPIVTTLRNPVPMSIRTDQEMAGMLMWVPGCIIYAVTSIEIILHWYDASPVMESQTIANGHPGLNTGRVVNENSIIQVKIQKTIT